MKKPAAKNILLGVTSSIAAYRALDLIKLFREQGHTVNVVLTRDAEHFVTPLSLQSFSGTEVVREFFSLEGRVRPIHIELAKKADLILIAPASADILAKLAHGLADDVLTCTVLASEAPLVIAPAMNEKMYYKKVTQENIKKLKEHGAVFVGPIEGHLVCSDIGMGHLAEDESIVKAVKNCLSK
jgi:phosphopantothenoylcysteine synthetase/decarboxylase